MVKKQSVFKAEIYEAPQILIIPIRSKHNIAESAYGNSISSMEFENEN